MNKTLLNSWITLLAFVILGYLISHLSYNMILQPIMKGHDTFALTAFTDWLKPVLMFFVMLLGILFNFVYTEVSRIASAGKQKVKIGKLLSGLKANPRLWMAICVSPLVFYSIYYYTKEQPDNFSGAFIAFQNGFFWQAIFNGFRKKVE